MEIFKLFGSILINTDEADKSLSKTEKSTDSFASKLGKGISTAAKWGAGIAVAAGTAALAVGKAAVSAASESETAFNKVSTLLTGSENELNTYYKNMKAASTDAGVGFSEFSDAVYQSISASIDQADAIDFANKAIKLSKAGFTDAATAVDVMTTAINAYGLSAEEAEHISDALITTQNLGKTTVNELASSMGRVIPLASAYGVNLDNLTTSYAELTKGGIATSEATTYMKSMFTELAKDGSKVSKVLKNETGQSFSDLMNSGKSLGDVLNIIYGSVDSDATAFAGLWSSTEAGTGALALAKSGVEGFNKTLSEMQNSLGTTESAYAKVTDSFEEKINKLKTAGKNMMSDIGDQLLPYVEGIMDWILNNMPQIQTVLQTVFSVIGTFVTTAGDVIRSFLATLRESADSTGITFTDVFTAIQTVVNTAFSVIQTIWDTIGKPCFDAVQLVLGAVSDYFADKMPAISAFVKSAFGDIKDIWVNNLQPCLKAIGDFIRDVLAPAFKFVFNNVIAPVVNAAFKMIKDLWTGTLKPVFKGILDFLTGVFTGDWEKAFKGLSDIVKGVFDGLITVVKAPLNAVIGIINKFISGVNKLKIPDWVPNVGGKNPNIPSIPLLAKGGTVTSSGRVIVGDAGPEELELPVGATVRPLTDKNTAFGTERVEELLELILAVLKALNEELYDIIVDALVNGVKLDVNGREIGRLVRKYA